MSHDRVEDEAAIDAMLSEMYRAWAANDADGFVKYYTDDATAILPGSLRGSRKAIRDPMVAGFDGPLRDSSTVDRQLSLRFVGEDAAIAVSEGGILFDGEDAVPEARKIHATWQLRPVGANGQPGFAAYQRIGETYKLHTVQLFTLAPAELDPSSDQARRRSSARDQHGAEPEQHFAESAPDARRDLREGNLLPTEAAVRAIHAGGALKLRTVRCGRGRE
jgi:uncharacterized protein (TIGR02246 family)